MFVIQSSGITDYETTKLMDACLELGIPYKDVGLIPFTEKIVNIENVELEDNPIFYGSTKLVKLILNSEFSDGVFFNYNLFNVPMWNASRKDMLNQDAILMTVGEFLKGEGEAFIRPFQDLKAFDGAVVIDRHKWFEQNSYSRTLFNEGNLVSVSKPKDIFAEFRFFIVDSKVVSGSLVKVGGRLRPELLSLDALDKAQAFADVWLPNENCVMDVALLPNGENKVIEFNCINASGFYANDVKVIATSLMKFINEKNASEKKSKTYTKKERKEKK